MVAQPGVMPEVPRPPARVPYCDDVRSEAGVVWCSKNLARNVLFVVHCDGPAPQAWGGS